MNICGDVYVPSSGLGDYVYQRHHTLMFPLIGRKVEPVLLEVRHLGIPVAVGIDVHIDLQRREASFQHIIHHLFDFVEIHARRHLTIGINTDLISELTTEQFVDRYTQGFALQIPESDFDPGQRGNERA